jgi:hypothetical protein
LIHVALPASSCHDVKTGGWRTLGDISPVARLRELGSQCGRSHDHFSVKAAELDALVQALKRDVEGLLVQVSLLVLSSLSPDINK